MNKRYFLFCLLFIFLVCSDDPSKLKRKKHFRSKPSDYVEYHPYTQKVDGLFKEADFSWKAKSDKIQHEAYFNSTIYISLWFHDSGRIDKISQAVQVLQYPHIAHHDKDASQYRWGSSGKQLEYYESGALKISSCNVAKDYVPSEKCGEEIHYKEDGSIEKKINHPQKCTQGCDLMIPYREEGKYIAMKDGIQIWDTSIMDKQYKYLKERTGEPKKVLKKGDVVTVVEDLQLTESGNTAPWVKVKLGLFSYGYVSSDHLDGPFE